MPAPQPVENSRKMKEREKERETEWERGRVHEIHVMLFCGAYEKRIAWFGFVSSTWPCHRNMVEYSTFLLLLLFLSVRFVCMWVFCNVEVKSLFIPYTLFAFSVQSLISRYCLEMMQDARRAKTPEWKRLLSLSISASVSVSHWTGNKAS